MLPAASLYVRYGPVWPTVCALPYWDMKNAGALVHTYSEVRETPQDYQYAKTLSSEGNPLTSLGLVQFPSAPRVEVNRFSTILLIVFSLYCNAHEHIS